MPALRLGDLLDGDAQLATAEFALVAAATRWPLDAAASSRIKAIAATVTDWPRVAMIVDRHRVAGLFAAGIGALCPDAETQATIHGLARDSAVQELGSVFETLRLVRVLDAAGIPVRVLKGASAAILAFGRFGLRYSMDIDLLVGRSSVVHAARLLDAQGYVRVEPPADAGAAMLRARMARYKDIAFEHPDTGILVELHWRLFQNPYLLRGADLDRHAQMQLVPGASVSVLPRDQAILYMFAHGTEHGWARLKWLADIGAIFASEPADSVDLFYAGVRDRNVERLVAPGLILGHALYGTPLPDAVRTDMAKDWRMRALLRTAYASLVGEEDGTELEHLPHATTRKNLSHYLISRDPRFLLHELRYDLLDRAADDAAGTSRLTRVARRLWGLITMQGGGARGNRGAASS